MKDAIRQLRKAVGTPALMLLVPLSRGLQRVVIGIRERQKGYN